MATTDRKARLPKVTQACDTCRTRKTKCDGASPCANCVHHGFSCAYNVTPAVPAPKKRKRIERPIVQPPGPSSYSQSGTSPHTPVSSVSSIPTSTTADPYLRRSSEADVYPGHAAIEHDLAKSLDDIRVHAEEREFHGPSGILSFLSKLRAKAHQARPHILTPEDTNVQCKSSKQHPSPGSPLVNPQAISPDVTRLCVRQYLQNLHLINPFIDPTKFSPHSERIVGDRKPAEIPPNHPERHFVALYYAVAALGAITAAEDSIPLDNLASNSGLTSVTPRALAETYFSLAKRYLGDIFESTSIDSVCVLFLLAVYCQNALRPHACYQYSGMAVRSALAIGVPSSSGSSTSEIRRCLWWTLYSHELEICSSVGRSSALLDPQSYNIPMPETIESPVSIIEPMVAFAAVVGDISKQLYHLGLEANISERSRTTMEFNYRLDKWRAALPLALHPDITNLQAPEWRLKQKVVLNLRFHNARILLHRPFLLSLGSTNFEPCISDHVRLCVEASQSTISILHGAYLNHPYFRTWWYNTTYVLYATMVILYVLLSGLSDFSDGELLQSVRQGLDVLETMKSDVVANHCADIVQEVLAIVTQLVKERSAQTQQSSFQPQMALPSPEMELSLQVDPNAANAWSFDGDLFNNLVDSNFIDSLLQADLWMGVQGMM